MPRRSAADAALTRIALVDAARQCFVTDGYSATTTTDIAARAGCSQSALFHHFVDKTELFAVVVAAEVKAYDEAVGRAALAAHGGPLEQVLAGCRRSLELASDPAWSRLVAIDAPSVLGADRFHELDADIGLKSTNFAVKALVGGRILRDDTDINALALVLYGSLTSAALELGRRWRQSRSAFPAVTGGSEEALQSDIDRVMAVVKVLILAYS